MQLPSPGQLVKESLTLPRNAARRLLGVPLDLRSGGALMLLAVIAGTLVAEAMRWVLPGTVGGFQDALLAQPVVAVGLQFGLLVLMSLAAAVIGRALGGTGTLPQALVLIAWLQVMMVLIQLVQFVLLLLIPLFGLLVGIASVIWFFWALAVFIAELHGFENVLKVLGMILLSMVSILFAFAVLLSLLGVSMPQIG